jgi:glycerol-3-phosphate acyltransferase PlsX
MVIAVDAMGGDNAPDEIVKGAILAVKEMTGFEVLLIGDCEKIWDIMAREGFSGDRIKIRHTSEVITNDESPTRALRQKKDSSLTVGFNLVKSGQADCLVSAGSSGALLAGSVLILQKIKGVDRPAVATAVPTVSGNILLIDSGFNTNVKPVNYVQFGYLGSAYMRASFGCGNPRVGLVNIGVEDEKGSPEIKEANRLLRESGLNFIGNMESRDFFKNVADVAVTDGFTGNVMLKLVEGTTDFMFGELKKVFMTNARTKMGAAMVMKELKELKHSVDTDVLGGAPVLGVDGLVIKSHGTSTARTIKFVIAKAQKLIETDFIGEIKREFAEIYPAEPGKAEPSGA